MQKILGYLMLVFLFSHCATVAKHNKKLEKPLAVKQLKEDIRFVQKKIDKLHPNKTLYIQEEALKNSFDSLVEVMNKPLKPNELYMALAPVVAQVKQGHMSMSLRLPKTNKKEQKRLSQLGMGPLSQIPMVFWNQNFYLQKNLTQDSTLIIGSKVEKINGISLKDLYQKYLPTFSSDGFNQTYFPYKFMRSFAGLYQLEMGLKDTLRVEFSHQDSIYHKKIIRKPKVASQKIVKVVDTLQVKPSKSELKALKKKQKLFLYNKANGTYQYDYKILGKDSSVALLKISSFSSGKYPKIYKHVFKDLQEKSIQHLIIDLRGNTGGLLNNVHALYRYLSTEPVKMINKPTVTSKNSLSTPYFNTAPWYTYPIAVPAYPFFYGFQHLKTKKEGDNYTYSLASNQYKKPYAEAFKGRVYVIVDGGSFSASSLLSARIQADQRGLIFGEETGGAFNSTVAGFMNKYKLPNSRLPFRLGIMNIESVKQSETFGRGVIPDVPITLSLEDKLNKQEVFLEKVLKFINN